MQQALEQALDRAEYIIESARQRPPKRKYLSSGRKSVFQKLYDLYIEECEKEPEIKQKLRRNVNLLEKLVMQETLSCLVVNLYPGNEGYSLMLRGKNGSDSETIRLPYEEGELLEYLDAEELPPILVDLLEKSQVNIFHCGCVIAEIRDYRQSGNMKSPTYQSKHILLRPTMQTLICDVHSITSDNHKWTQEDKLLLESQLILATAEPLCLDPSIAVTCTTNRLLYNKQKMNTRPMKRCFKRYSKSSLNRQQEVAHYSTPPQLRLVDYVQKKKEKKVAQQYDLKISKAGNCVDMWKQNPCYLTAPSEVDVEKYAKVESSIKPDDSQPTVWPAHEVKDDYVFECEVGNQLQKTKLTIFQSLGNPLYYGKIQTLKGDDESDSLLVPPQFLIGSKTDAERVVNQYHELVKSEAKCPVKMFHNSGGSISLSHLSPGKEMEQPESISGSVQSSVLGKGVKHRPPPIKLPSSSGSSSSGNIFSPQQSSGHLKSPTPPPPPPSSKPPGLSRKQSMDLNQVSMLSPAAMSPASSSQRTTSTQVMANPAGLNFINVVGSVCGAQTLMSGSNPMLGCNTGAIAPAGINLSSILPPGGLVPSALPATMQSASQAGSPFGLKNASNLRPLNLLQGSDQGPSNQDQALSAQQAAVINLTGVGNFMQPQATAVAILAASNGYGSSNSSSTSSSSATSAAFRQPLKK
ncbi:transcription factor SPT20 homolog isoform X10 [Coturnix japonica]|uniref:transcription factor SPT20 homolog isoform X10 n=1 Tax=Coturnix japonica TaxID=93934 RepID=UPI000776D0A1|nr:transcription factor SPT20 homolog isoform X10 [Coturnix japonica]